MTRLLDYLRARQDANSKLLVPYLMGGIPDRESFRPAFEAVARHADAVELGLPFSDPLMDGPVIAAAGERALRNGSGPLEVLESARGGPGGGTQFVAMTYYNPIHAIGEIQFCERLADVRAAGLIVPDLPLEESEGLRAAAARFDLAWIPLVAPTSSEERVRAIVGTATGFVYAVSTLGVTGTRAALSERARRVFDVCRSATELPILVGIGVSNEAQAREACGYADGVVIGSAVVQLVLEEGAEAAASFLERIRKAISSDSG